MVENPAKIKYIEWLETPRADRTPKSKRDLAKVLGVSPSLLQKWDEKHREMEGARLVEQIKAMDAAMFEAGTGKKVVSAAELWYKRQGLLVEKQEIEHRVLTADDISRLTKEADTELRKDLERIQEVREEPRLLPDKIR